MLNSFLYGAASAGNFYTTGEAIGKWATVQLFGIFILLFNLIPTPNWWGKFHSNTIFWMELWFTDKYKDLDREVIWALKKWHGSSRQYKAIVKKYGYDKVD